MNELDYTERIWRYQDNLSCVEIWPRLSFGLYREDLAVSGQPIGGLQAEPL